MFYVLLQYVAMTTCCRHVIVLVQMLQLREMGGRRADLTVM